MNPLLLMGLATGGSFLLNKIFGSDPSTSQQSTMTPEQQAMLKKLLGGFSGMDFDTFTGNNPYTPEEYSGGYTPTDYTGGYTPEKYSGGYTPTGYGGNEYQTLIRDALTRSLSGDATPSTNINPQATEDYYRNVIENPSIQQYEDVVRPEWMQRISNIHSSARDTMEQKGIENLYSDLRSQRANLMYQDEQARRGLAESAANRALQAQLAGLGTGTELSGQDLEAWKNMQNLNLQANQQDMDVWQIMQNLGLDTEKLKQNQWFNENTLNLEANQQDQNAWETYQKLLLGANQNDQAYQSSLQNFLLQLLGQQGFENIVTPGYNPFQVGFGVNANV